MQNKVQSKCTITIWYLVPDLIVVSLLLLDASCAESREKDLLLELSILRVSEYFSRSFTFDMIE